MILTDSGHSRYLLDRDSSVTRRLSSASSISRSVAITKSKSRKTLPRCSMRLSSRSVTGSETAGLLAWQVQEEPGKGEIPFSAAGGGEVVQGKDDALGQHPVV